MQFYSTALFDLKRNKLRVFSLSRIEHDSSSIIIDSDIRHFCDQVKASLKLKENVLISTAGLALEKKVYKGSVPAYFEHQKDFFVINHGYIKIGWQLYAPSPSFIPFPSRFRQVICRWGKNIVKWGPEVFSAIAVEVYCVCKKARWHELNLP